MTQPPRTPYEALGDDGVRRLVDRFYDLMDTRPQAAGIRKMHAPSLAPIRDRLTVFLTGWMGGPSTYAERFGAVNVPSAHAPYDIGPEEREAWLACMKQAVEESALPPELAGLVMQKMAGMAEMCRTVEDDGTVRPQFRALRDAGVNS